ncbi:MAG TPA: PEGA domain-containing protein [Polyangiales bacterium]|nr:PEGA domain-containing protein [Polyangiales bacterium]
MRIGELPERVFSTLGVAKGRVIDSAVMQTRHQRQRALSALTQLHDVDAAIALARQATFALQEDKALRALSRAEHILEETLALPGASVFYAELQLQLGVSAAHSGLATLADAAFTRAASIDPARHLLAGEAAPEVVELAKRAFERVASAKEGTLHIAVDVTPAHVFIDDRAVGDAPLAVRVQSGLHVLRIESEGHVPYARLFEMLEGERPEWRVMLSPDAATLALRELDRARQRQAAQEIEAACGQIFALEPQLGMLLFGEHIAERGWFARCEPGACAIATYADGAGESVHVQRVDKLTSPAFTDARAWLTPERSVVAAKQAAAPPLWHRWYVWAAAGAVVVGAGLWVGAVSQPDPQHSLRVSVDPSALR